MSTLSEHYKKENQHAIHELHEVDQISIKRVMSRMSIFKVNSYDAGVIQHDLIGMAQEYRLRGESFDQAIGCELKAFTDGVVANSNGRSFVEILLRYVSHTSLYLGTAMVVSAQLLYSTWVWVDIPQLLLVVWLIASTLGFLAEHILKPKFCFETGWKRNIPQLIALMVFVGVIGLIQWLSIGQKTMTIDVREVAPILFGIYFAAVYGNRLNLRRFAKNSQAS